PGPVWVTSRSAWSAATVVLAEAVLDVGPGSLWLPLIVTVLTNPPVVVVCSTIVRFAVADRAMAPIVQITVVVPVQPALDEPLTKVVPAGRPSVSTTPVVAVGPLFVAVSW